MNKVKLSYEVIRDARTAAANRGIEIPISVWDQLWSAVSDEASARRAFGRAARSLSKYADELGDESGRCDAGWARSAFEDLSRAERDVKEAARRVSALYSVAVDFGVFEPADEVVVSVER